jgi:hypothetical protein
MSSIPMNNNHERMQYLLKQLSLERLDRDGAMELRPLLVEESQNTRDPRYRKILLRLIDILDKYVDGEVNLMPYITVSNVV